MRRQDDERDRRLGRRLQNHRGGIADLYAELAVHRPRLLEMEALAHVRLGHGRGGDVEDRRLCPSCAAMVRAMGSAVTAAGEPSSATSTTGCRGCCRGVIGIPPAIVRPRPPADTSRPSAREPVCPGTEMYRE